jgi:hypothetical protein
VHAERKAQRIGVRNHDILKSLLTEASALTNDFIQKIMQWENSVKAGWNRKHTTLVSA